ncbi:protein lifeguard 1-like isoform X1 [Ptychodera flava]|uniref:protein lifeguard 1-like isoform X1 n=1 Tax=Ptychodera flava TaxID=63121 RepID=UPI003969F704
MDPEYNTFVEEEGGFQTNTAYEFSEKEVRHAFIKKVYAILCSQLVVTIGIICIFLFADPVREYTFKNTWVWWVALAATFICLIAMACCEGVRRKFPTNFIFLGIFTVCEGVLLGCACSTFDTDVVLIAAGITAIVALALTIFAFQTKIDFTMCSGLLFVLLIVLLLFGIFAIIFRNRVLDMVYASLGALVFAGYLVVDTQLMMGGSHKYSISPEEYIFAALNLYLDIINLFLMILLLVGRGRG